jgi:(E)-4-hydroxy-3-methylbut-2-enyl-diphosphate synthase
MVGKVPVGGDAPITVQTMTNTITGDARATIDQIRAIEEAGADIVRVSCPDEDATKAMRAITRASTIPVVADIHFHYKRAIEAAEAGAACLRINPGNIGSAARVREVVKAAKDHGVSMRIGVNAGSLEKELLEKYGEPCPEAMVESALNHAKILDDLDFREYKISVKASDAFLAVAAYQQLAEAVDCPIHLGITEAGGMISGTVKSSIGMGMLLWSGIGDTIRVSLSADPVEEVRVGFDILKSLNLRHRGVNIVSCPSCARQGFNVIDTVRTVPVKHVKPILPSPAAAQARVTARSISTASRPIVSTTKSWSSTSSNSARRKLPRSRRRAETCRFWSRRSKALYRSFRFRAVTFIPVASAV